MTMDANFRSAFELKEWLQQQEGTTLRAWLKHFDTNHDHGVTFAEFQRGMRAMGYTGDYLHIFEMLDDDKSGELGMEEVDPDLTDFWHLFLSWSIEQFTGVDEMLLAFGGEEAVASRRILQADFVRELPKLGWQNGGEDLLFQSLDIGANGSVRVQDLFWLDAELARLADKQAARQKVERATPSRSQRKKQVEAPEVKIAIFKQFLLKKFGGYMRAWRQGLCPWDGSSIAKSQFLKACFVMAWRHEVKDLWRAFDKDGNGSISIDELDLSSAEVFARFQRFIIGEFGCTSNAFAALDLKGKLSITHEDFITALAYYHFAPCTASDCKLLFHGLDRDGTKMLVESDFAFLDGWRPLPILTAQRNTRAVEALKTVLVQQFRTVLKAWRRLFDRSQTNTCTWDFFCINCKSVGFQTDLAGAWRAMDPNLTGAITYSCLDPQGGAVLWDFKRWAETDFGSLPCAFDALDSDGSNRLTFKEFRRSCRIYGYRGDWKLVFKVLDSEQTGFLTRADVEAVAPWRIEFSLLRQEQAPPASPRTPDRACSQRRLPSKEPAVARPTTHGQWLGGSPRRMYFIPTEEAQYHAEHVQFPMVPQLLGHQEDEGFKSRCLDEEGLEMMPLTPKKWAHSSLGLAESLYSRPLRQRHPSSSCFPAKPHTAGSGVRPRSWQRAPKGVGLHLHSIWSGSIPRVSGS
eukprot:CAMPEP_0178441686 /NCGR_PEP_ID=MMETSP0689_2-20121128/37639_1 /TAXON_ID=160604 /ORGANISM="Amphidinium massartii, Strain CS-259" /LENGTH=687 /DNA_ID=CAMNT_0020064933 /DNA_START=56 /DNA_END=2115 /DNA_ORIENTATION=+